MRKFFISDIHGNYAALIRLLEYANIDYSTDHLIIGGDLIDRGFNSAQVVRKIRKLQQTYPENVIVLMGNHEEMIRFYVEGISDMWFLHGGLETIQSFETTFTSEDELIKHIHWVMNLPLTYEDDEYVYIHAGLNANEPLHNQPRDTLWWQKDDLYRIDPTTLFLIPKIKKSFTDIPLPNT